MNRSLFLHPRGGAPGWIAMPFTVIFEWLSPLIELAGYVFMIGGWLAGIISGAAAAAFMLVAVGFGVLLSVSALLLEETDFRIYPRFRHVAVLVTAAIAENLGYRQLMSWYRLIGLVRWATGRRATWGKMTRSAAWQK